MQICIQGLDATVDTETSPLYQVAYDRIRDMIVEGHLRPGETVSEVQLADQLDISRTPVREAVKRLVGQGLLQITPRGLRIFRPTAEDVAEVYFLRAAIEGAVARAAAARICAADLGDLRGLHAEGERAAERGDVPLLVALNGRFHGIIAAACGSGRAAEALRGLDPLVAAYRRLSLLSPDHQKRSVAEHGLLIDRLERRDGPAAEALMREHIACAGRRVVEAVRQLEPTAPPADGSQLTNLDALADLAKPSR
jgi:GntR family transcriptional regulator, rspAB operon transcriptional repressor